MVTLHTSFSNTIPPFPSWIVPKQSMSHYPPDQALWNIYNAYHRHTLRGSGMSWSTSLRWAIGQSCTVSSVLARCPASGLNDGRTRHILTVRLSRQCLHFSRPPSSQAGRLRHQAISQRSPLHPFAKDSVTYHLWSPSRVHPCWKLERTFIRRRVVLLICSTLYYDPSLRWWLPLPLHLLQILLPPSLPPPLQFFFRVAIGMAGSTQGSSPEFSTSSSLFNYQVSLPPKEI